MDYKINISKEYSKEEFIISMELFAASEEIRFFKFREDGSKRIERLGLNIVNSDGKPLNPYFYENANIAPSGVNETNHPISMSDGFKYKIVGLVKETDDGIYLDFGPAKYFLGKNENYDFYIKLAGAKSNVLNFEEG